MTMTHRRKFLNSHCAWGGNANRNHIVIPTETGPWTAWQYILKDILWGCGWLGFGKNKGLAPPFPSSSKAWTGDDSPPGKRHAAWHR